MHVLLNTLLLGTFISVSLYSARAGTFPCRAHTPYDVVTASLSPARVGSPVSRGAARTYRCTHTHTHTYVHVYIVYISILHLYSLIHTGCTYNIGVLARIYTYIYTYAMHGRVSGRKRRSALCRFFPPAPPPPSAFSGRRRCTLLHHALPAL